MNHLLFSNIIFLFIIRINGKSTMNNCWNDGLDSGQFTGTAKECMKYVKRLNCSIHLMARGHELSKEEEIELNGTINLLFTSTCWQDNQLNLDSGARIKRYSEDITFPASGTNYEIENRPGSNDNVNYSRNGKEADLVNHTSISWARLNGTMIELNSEPPIAYITGSNLTDLRINCSLDTFFEWARNLGNAWKEIEKSKSVQECSTIMDSSSYLKEHRLRCKVDELNALLGSIVREHIETWVKWCIQRYVDWAPRNHFKEEVMEEEEEKAENCIDEEGIKECDEGLSSNFDIGRDIITDPSQCFRVSKYGRCIDHLVDNSCTSSINVTIIEMMKRILKLRLKVKEGLCPPLSDGPSDNHVQLAIQSQYALNIIMGPECAAKANPVIGVCVRQYQKRMMDMVSNTKEYGQNQMISNLCCAYEEYRGCSYIISMVKCGKKVGQKVSGRLLKLSQFSRETCSPYSYDSETCSKLLLGSSAPRSSPSVAFFICGFLIVFKITL